MIPHSFCFLLFEQWPVLCKTIDFFFSSVLFLYFLFPLIFPRPHLLRVSSPQSMPHFFTQPNFSLCLQTPQYKAKFVGSLKRGDIVQTFPPGPNKINFTKSVRRSTAECEWSDQHNFGKNLFLPCQIIHPGILSWNLICHHTIQMCFWRVCHIFHKIDY